MSRVPRPAARGGCGRANAPLPRGRAATGPGSRRLAHPQVPLGEQPDLAQAIGFGGKLWVKNETGNVSGSHKARHLMGVMLYLRVIAAARLSVGDGLAHRRLAIASCGNAALAAAVIARAADWPLDVFIPPDASAAVVGRLKELGAKIAVCARQGGEAGGGCAGQEAAPVDHRTTRPQSSSK